MVNRVVLVSADNPRAYNLVLVSLHVNVPSPVACLQITSWAKNHTMPLNLAGCFVIMNHTRLSESWNSFVKKHQVPFSIPTSSSSLSSAIKSYVTWPGNKNSFGRTGEPCECWMGTLIWVIPLKSILYFICKELNHWSNANVTCIWICSTIIVKDLWKIKFIPFSSDHYAVIDWWLLLLLVTVI